jgi:hypothetical protein
VHHEPVTWLGPQLAAELLEGVGRGGLAVRVVRVVLVGSLVGVLVVGGSLVVDLDLGDLRADGLVVGAVGRLVGELRRDLVGQLEVGVVVSVVALGVRQAA